MCKLYSWLEIPNLDPTSPTRMMPFNSLLAQSQLRAQFYPIFLDWCRCTNKACAASFDGVALTADICSLTFGLYGSYPGVGKLDRIGPLLLPSSGSAIILRNYTSQLHKYIHKCTYVYTCALMYISVLYIHDVIITLNEFCVLILHFCLPIIG